LRRLASIAALVALTLVPAAASAPSDYPDVTQFVPIAAGAYEVANRPTDLFIKYIVIHDTEGNYPTTFSIFTSPTACCSVHYLVDGQAGASYPAVSQFVHDRDIAYHAGNFWFNQHSIGIEHDGFADGPVGFYTPQMYKRSATLAGWIAAQYGIPIDRAHIVSHANLPGPNQSFTSGMHWDPGPFWDWPYYMKLVRLAYKGWTKKSFPTPEVPRRYRKTRPSIRTISVGKEFAAASDVTDWSSSRHVEFANVYAEPPDELLLGASDPTTWTSPTVYNVRDWICDNLPNVTSANGMDQLSDQRAKADWGEAFVKIGKSRRIGGVLYDRIWFNGVRGWVKRRETSNGWGVIATFKTGVTMYGKPILAASNEICPDMPFELSQGRAGQSYVAQTTATDPASNTLFYGIFYNHRLAWVPASEVTIR